MSKFSRTLTFTFPKSNLVEMQIGNIFGNNTTAVSKLDTFDIKINYKEGTGTVTLVSDKASIIEEVKDELVRLGQYQRLEFVEKGQTL